jgi:hypothetical protein
MRTTTASLQISSVRSSSQSNIRIIFSSSQECRTYYLFSLPRNTEKILPAVDSALGTQESRNIQQQHHRGNTAPSCLPPADCCGSGRGVCNGTLSQPLSHTPTRAKSTTTAVAARRQGAPRNGEDNNSAIVDDLAAAAAVLTVFLFVLRGKHWLAVLPARSGWDSCWGALSQLLYSW